MYVLSIILVETDGTNNKFYITLLIMPCTVDTNLVEKLLILKIVVFPPLFILA
jgi:hypothetical protein